MTQQCEKKKTGLTDMETRQHRYAFRKAMSNGLQKAFQPVTGRHAETGREVDLGLPHRLGIEIRLVRTVTGRSGRLERMGHEASLAKQSIAATPRVSARPQSRKDRASSSAARS